MMTTGYILLCRSSTPQEIFTLGLRFVLKQEAMPGAA